MNILVIDDDKIVAMSLKTILEASGSIKVLAMGENGKQAVELYEKYNPDVLLMDIRMDGMTGLEAGEIILKNTRMQKFFFLPHFPMMNIS